MKNNQKTITVTRHLVALFMLAGVSGCATTPPKEQHYFVLSQSTSSQSSSVSGKPIASISRVNLPDYLNQQYLVRQRSDNVITVMTNELWAEKLSRSIPAILAGEIASDVGRPIETHPLPPGIRIDTTIEINIRQLIASDRRLVLKADYRIVKPPKLVSHPFETTLSLADKSSKALVTGYNQALAKLASAIAKKLSM